MRVPKHLAIIPDGNRRWARKRGLPTFEGHRRGFDRAIEIVKKARELGIHTVTLWAFSTENWKRTKKEVSYLMKLYEIMIDKFLPEARKDRVKIIHLGRKDRIPQSLKKKIERAEEETKNYQAHVLNIALDYGGRDEILRAVIRMMDHLRGGRRDSSEVKLTEQEFSQYLDTAGMPDPDLIIRTGGEKRLSGFMLWQCQYSELYFTKTLMPDFGPKELEKAIKDYSKRQRRFGK